MGKGLQYYARITGPGVDLVRRLPSDGLVTIGRRDADIEIDHPSLAARHAVLHMGGARLAIEDRESDTGTRVGGRKIAAGTRHPLGVAEAALIGELTLTVLRSGEHGTAAAVSAAPAATTTTAAAAAAPTTYAPTHRLPAQALPESGATAEAADLAGAGGDDPSTRALHRSLARVAASNLSVLLLGEIGVGKATLATELHARSRRADRPFVRFDCTGLLEPTLQSELFGHARGAMAGALQPKPGVLERADGGTVFLDSVAELPLSIQTQLLRVVAEGCVVRIGELEPRRIDVRYVIGSNRDLELEVRNGAFRRDLYFRLAAMTLRVPPLRERSRDLARLVRDCIVASSQQAGIAPPQLAPDAWALLSAHSWPGNLRELENVIEQAVLLSTSGTITAAELPHLSPIAASAPAWLGQSAGAQPLPLPSGFAAGETATIEADERERIVSALAKCAGSQTRAAKLLGISRGTLVARLDSYALPRPRKQARSR